MTEILKILNDFWALLIPIGGSVMGYLKWKNNKLIQERNFENSERKREKEEKENELQSTQMMYDELERIKQKLILQVNKEVDQATELAEKKRIIAEFRIQCPDCYVKHFAPK